MALTAMRLRIPFRLPQFLTCTFPSPTTKIPTAATPEFRFVIEKALSPHVEQPESAAWLADTFERIGMLADIAGMACVTQEKVVGNTDGAMELDPDEENDGASLPLVQTSSHLIGRLCDVYVSAFAKDIQFSRDQNSNEITGPLIRFINQCLAVLGEEIPDETVYKIARKHRV